MGPVNMKAVVLAALVAMVLAPIWYRMWRAKGPALWRLPALLAPAWLIGHNFARVGAASLAAKPWLYWMMSGGWALMIVVPVGFVAYGRAPKRRGALDAGYVLCAFLAMGTVFWAMR